MVDMEVKTLDKMILVYGNLSTFSLNYLLTA